MSKAQTSTRQRNRRCSPALAAASLATGGVDKATQSVANVLAELRRSRRPVIVAGNGVHIAQAEDAFLRFVERLRVPVVTTIGGMDLLGETHPYYAGRFGPTGQRRANFTVQNADLVLSIGSGLSVAAIGFDGAGFAPRARKIMVNVDPNEGRRPHLRLRSGCGDGRPRLHGPADRSDGVG